MASEDAHNASQEHERVVGFFPIFSIGQVSEFFAEPRTRNKTQSYT